MWATSDTFQGTSNEEERAAVEGFLEPLDDKVVQLVNPILHSCWHPKKPILAVANIHSLFLFSQKLS